MVHRFDRITSDPARMNGQPCIRGMRLTARRVVAAVALYPDRAELKREYPELEDEDIRQALAKGALITVTERNIRVRHLPIGWPSPKQRRQP